MAVVGSTRFEITPVMDSSRSFAPISPAAAHLLNEPNPSRSSQETA
jgi:hypothetical protein